MEFIEVMRRNDTREMLLYMDKIYESRIGIPGWTADESTLPSKKDMVMAAHDMIRLALSISQPVKDLLKEIGELKKEIKELRSHKHSDPYVHGAIATTQGDARDPSSWKTTEQNPKNYGVKPLSDLTYKQTTGR